MLIKNAQIIDGTGSAPYSGHILLKENRIESILTNTDAIPNDESLGIIDAKH